MSDQKSSPSEEVQDSIPNMVADYYKAIGFNVDGLADMLTQASNKADFNKFPVEPKTTTCLVDNKFIAYNILPKDEYIDPVENEFIENQNFEPFENDGCGA